MDWCLRWFGFPVCMLHIAQSKKRAQTRGRLNEIEEVLSKRDHEVIYGSPEMLRERAESTRRLEQERDSLKQELEKVEKEMK
jgi:hypothetical protein